MNIPSQEQSRGRDGDFKSHRLGKKREKQQLLTEMRPVECDFSGEGSSEKRKSREDELRDGICVDHKGLMGKESFRFQLQRRSHLSALLWGGLGRCQEGTGSPFGVRATEPAWWKTQTRPFHPPLVPQEETYWHQRAAHTLR